LSFAIDSPFIIRLTSEAAEARLFTNRWLFVGLRRSWTKGSKILFVRKIDGFLGYGIIAGIQQIEELDAQERQLCLEKNWSAKISFSKLTRFLPPVPIEDTQLAAENLLTLHGSLITSQKCLEIEGMAEAKITF
jgi:hypothetical protein